MPASAGGDGCAWPTGRVCAGAAGADDGRQVVAGAAPRPASSAAPHASLDALQQALKQEMAAAPARAAAECTAVELRLGLNAITPLVRPSIGPYAEGGARDLPREFTASAARGRPAAGPAAPHGAHHPQAPMGAIINPADATSSPIVQRAASRGIVQVIEAADGFRYTFNNAWAAKDGEGSRFSYVCQDSMQNKDRHANGYTRVLKHLKHPDGAERGPRKPTYDCKGSVIVKFSANRQSCDVYYRHCPIHDTVAPRNTVAPRTATTLRLEPHPAHRSASVQPEGHASSPFALADGESNATPSASNNVSRPRKRQRKRTPPPPPPQVNRGPSTLLSLADLLRQSGAASVSAPSVATQPPRLSSKPPAHVAYDLPAWQPPPPPPFDQQPAAMNATALEQNPAQHVRLGAPPNNHPRPPALFTTLKQVPAARGRLPPTDAVPWPVESYNEPQFPPGPTQSVKRNPRRATPSCTNCRCGKPRYDEGQPCGTCVNSDRANNCIPDAPRTTMVRNPWPKSAASPQQPSPGQHIQAPSTGSSSSKL